MGLLDIVGSGGIDALEQVLIMTHERHKALADNIANIDTPGYRARDIDKAAFESELAKAIAQARKNNPNAGRVSFKPSDGKELGGPSRLRRLVFHDDNNRSVEDLMVEMSKNSIQQSQAAALLRNQLNLFRVVVSENV